MKRIQFPILQIYHRIIIVVPYTNPIEKAVNGNDGAGQRQHHGYKVGIKPPLDNMVNVNRNIIKPLPGKSFLDKGYAAITVRHTLINVPAKV